MTLLEGREGGDIKTMKICFLCFRFLVHRCEKTFLRRRSGHQVNFFGPNYFYTKSFWQQSSHAMKIETFQAMGIKEKGVVVLLELPVCKNSFPAPTHVPPSPPRRWAMKKKWLLKTSHALAAQFPIEIHRKTLQLKRTKFKNHYCVYVAGYFKYGKHCQRHFELRYCLVKSQSKI